MQSSVRDFKNFHFLGGVPNLEGSDKTWNTQPIEICHYGVPSEPFDFIGRAVPAGHPRGYDAFVEKGLHEVARDNFKKSAFAVARCRSDALRYWTKRASELSREGEKLHASLEPHLKNLLAGKRLLLCKEMLAEAGCADEHLVEDIVQAFPLSGWMRCSGSFLPQVRRPDMDIQTLRLLLKGLNKATLSKMQHRHDPDLERATWLETEKEIQNGWVWVDTSTASHSECCIAMRFGIRQGAKIRVIDDCSLCKLNSTVGLKERFQLHTVDSLAAALVQAFKESEASSFPSLCGRTFDLKSAYKQYGVATPDRSLLRIAVNKPGQDGQVLLGVNSLPFGSVASVAAFLRISYALWRIGVYLFKLVWSAFFDDYSCVCSGS